MNFKKNINGIAVTCISTAYFFGIVKGASYKIRVDEDGDFIVHRILRGGVYGEAKIFDKDYKLEIGLSFEEK